MAKKAMARMYLSLSLLFCSLLSISQDNLDFFKVTRNGNAVVVSWQHSRLEITELVVQRSLDPTKGFKSIMAMPDPAAVSNGYMDKKTDAARHYYRIFYVLHGGKYFFTEPQKATEGAADAYQSTTAGKISNPLLTLANLDAQNTGRKPETFSFYRSGTSSIEVPEKIEMVLPENMFTPSALIYTNREGNLSLALPDTDKKRYDLTVYLEDGSLLFKMKNIREPQLLVDRSNFFHSGWFRYDLFQSGVLKEKGRFFIPPEMQ